MKNFTLNITSFESQLPKEGEAILLFSLGNNKESNLEIFEIFKIFFC
jgi:hypothetical protein